MQGNPKSSGTFPSRIGRFEVRAFLGAGAFGAVYRAGDPLLGREVALKVAHPGLLDNPAQVERFLREARAAAGLRHPHLVPVYDAGREGDTYYLAAAFIEGRTLAQARKQGDLDIRQAVDVVRQLAEALAYAHRRGVVHRDVKPANVLVGTGVQAYLADFGLAHRQGTAEKLTHEGAVVGTPAYMAPEQAEGRIGEPLPASDQYSLGVVLYELLCGQTPFIGPPVSVLYEVLHKEPPPPRRLNPRLPRDLERVCLKAMAKRPADRYPDCQELADDLRRWLEGDPVRARPVGLPERAWRWGKREPALALASAAAALALLAAVLVPLLTSLSLAAAVRANEEAEKELNGKAENARQKKQEADLARASATAVAEKARAARKRADEQAKKAKEAEQQAAKKAESARAALREVERRKSNLMRFQYAADVQRAQYAREAADEAGLKKLLDGCKEELRGFEWRHLGRSNHVLRLSLPRPEGELRRFLCLGSREFLQARVVAVKGRPRLRVQVWDLKRRAETGQATLDWYERLLQPITFLAPDGRSVIQKNDPEALEVWDLGKNASRGRLRGHSRSVAAASFSRDGAFLATLHEDDALRVWDVLKAKVEFRIAAAELTGLALAPDGSTLAAAVGVETTLWEVKGEKKGEKKRATLREREGKVALARKRVGRKDASRRKDGTADLADTALAYAPDGKLLATSAGDEVKVWDVATGQERAALPVEDVVHLLFSPDGRTLLARTGQGGELSLWDATAGKKLARFDRIARGTDCAAFSPDGKFLALIHTPGDTVSLWDPLAGAARISLPLSQKGAIALAFTPDSSELAVVFPDGIVQVWPRLLLERATAFGKPGAAVTALAFDAQASSLAVTAGRAVNWWDLDKVVSRDTPAALQALLQKGATLCVASPGDGQLVAARTDAGVVLLRDGGAAVGPTLEGGPVREACCLAFSSDGKLLAAGVAGGSVRVWDTATGKQRLAREVHKTAVSALAVAAGGRLATVGAGRVLLGNLVSAESLALDGAKETKVTCLAFTPDGATLVTGSEAGTLVLWDVATRTPRVTVKGHSGAVRAVASSSDGKTVVSGGADGAVRLWETVTGGELLTLKEKVAEKAVAITALGFASNGAALAAGDASGEVRLWYGLPEKVAHGERGQ